MGLPMLIIGAAVCALLGIPTLFIGILYGMLNDIWLALGVFAFGFILPTILLFMELNNRRNYPIRVTVSYELGGERGQKNTFSTDDRIGYRETRDANGKSTGAKEWRLMDIGRSVQNFSYDYVGDKTIWAGLKVCRHAHIVAVMGEKGEEFFPQKYDTSTKSYKTVFEGDRGTRLLKIFSDIQARNHYTDWIKQNLIQLAITGIALMITVMLFLCFMQLSDVSKTLRDAMGSNNACIAANKYFQNATNFNTSQTTVKPAAGNTIAGVPFAFG